jgi:hypothetical protein
VRLEPSVGSNRLAHFAEKGVRLKQHGAVQDGSDVHCRARSGQIGAVACRRKVTLTGISHVSQQVAH